MYIIIVSLFRARAYVSNVKMAAAAIPIVLSLAPVALDIIEKYGPLVYELVLKIVARDMTLDYLKQVTSSTQFDKISASLAETKETSITLPRLFKILGAIDAPLVMSKILTNDLNQMNTTTNSNKSIDKSSSNSKINPDVAALTQLVLNSLKKSKYLAKGDDDDDDDKTNKPAAVKPTTAQSCSFVQTINFLLTRVEFDRLCRQHHHHNNNRHRPQQRSQKRLYEDDADDCCVNNVEDYELEQKWRTVVYKVKQAVLNSPNMLATSLFDGGNNNSSSSSNHDVKQMFENLTWQNMVHLLHFLSTRAVHAPCKICQHPNQLEHIFFEMWSNRHDLYNVLNVFYHCDLAVANEFVHFLKPTCYPDDGTYPWDMNIFMASLFKYHNYFKVYEPVTYHGVVYSKDTSIANLEIFAWQIVQSAVPRHAFLIACGTIQKPTHWCGIFIDMTISTAFFYNSIAHQHQLDWKVVDALNNLCDKLGVEHLKIKTRITNTKRLQGKSNLCGHFVYDFFSTMLRQPANKLKQVFTDYTNVPDELNKNSKSAADILDSTLHNKIKNKFHFMPRTNQPDRMFYSYLKKMKS